MKCRDRSTLSPREQEVYDLLTRGLTKKAIAEQLGISVCAVTELRASIGKRLHLPRGIELRKIREYLFKGA